MIFQHIWNVSTSLDQLQDSYLVLLTVRACALNISHVHGAEGGARLGVPVAGGEWFKYIFYLPNFVFLNVFNFLPLFLINRKINNCLLTC